MSPFSFAKNPSFGDSTFSIAVAQRLNAFFMRPIDESGPHDRERTMTVALATDSICPLSALMPFVAESATRRSRPARVGDDADSMPARILSNQHPRGA